MLDDYALFLALDFFLFSFVVVVFIECSVKLMVGKLSVKSEQICLH